MPNDIAGKSRAGKKLQELVQRRLHWIDPGRHQADNWAVLVQIGSVEDTPSGKVRTLVMPEDSIVKKRLVVQSQYSYTYAMVDRPEMTDYRSTVAVVPLDDKHSRIALMMHMTPAQGQTDEGITARYTRSLSGNLREMKKAHRLLL